jgi:hypothetical protein
MESSEQASKPATEGAPKTVQDLAKTRQLLRGPDGNEATKDPATEGQAAVRCTRAV